MCRKILWFGLVLTSALQNVPAQTTKLEKLLQAGLAVEEESNTLLSFFVSENNGQVQLIWRSVRDTSAGFFVVLSGTDVASLAVTGVVRAKTNVYSYPVQYCWNDPSGHQGIRFYKLLRIKNNGTYYMSDPVFRQQELAYNNH